MARFNRLLIGLAIVLAVASTGHAGDRMTVDDRLNQMDAQIALLQKEAQLNSLLMQSVDADLLQVPQIVSIMSINGTMFARLLLPNGTVATFTEGDTVKKGMRITAITRNNVIVGISNSQHGKGKKEKEVKSIALDYAAPAGSSQARTAGGVTGGGAAMPVSGVQAGGGMPATVGGSMGGGSVPPPNVNPSLLREFLPQPPAVQ